MKTVERRIVAAYIVSSDGKLLLGRKNLDRPSVYPDCWHTPGGGVDEGESDEAALVREVSEETGIDVMHVQVTLIDEVGTGEFSGTGAGGEPTTVKMQFHIFKVTVPMPAQDVKIIPSDELLQLTWFSRDELRDLELTPPSVELFTRLGQDWLYTD